MRLTDSIINEFKVYLIDNDKSAYTVEKYIRDVVKFKEYACDCEIEKETTEEYKNYLVRKGYSVRSILMDMISAFNEAYKKLK